MTKHTNSNSKVFYLDDQTSEAYDRNDVFYHRIYEESPCAYTAFEVHQPHALRDFDLYQFLTPEHITEISQGKRRLYFTNTHEAYVDMIYYVYEQIKKYNFRYDQVVIVSELADMHKRITNYAKQLKVPEVKCVWSRRFEHDVRWRRLMPIHEDSGILSRNKTLELKKYDKKYLNFNRRWRFHRPLLTAMLYNRDLLKHGHVSMGISDDNDRGWEQFDLKLDGYIRQGIVSPHIKNLLEHSMSNIMSLPEMYLDTPDLVTNRADLGDESYLYAETYFSVCSETNYFHRLTDNNDIFHRHETGVFFSEKIFKCLAYKHPFVVVSNPGFLSALKSVGYKTFSPWIDESYDMEIDDSIRMEKIVDEIERLCNLTESELTDFITAVKEICDYNYAVFVGKLKFYTQMWVENVHNVELNRKGGLPWLNQEAVNTMVTEVNQHISNGAEKVHFELFSEGAFNYYGSWPSNRFNDDLTTDPEECQRFHRGNFTELNGIHEILPMLNIDSEAVKFSCATANMDLVYERYCELTQPSNKIKIGYSNGFETKSRFDNIKLHPLPDKVTDWQDKKRFLCYNRNSHAQRMALIALLIKENLLDQGLVSFYPDPLKYDGHFTMELDKVYLPGKDEFYQEVKQILNDNSDMFPLNLDMTPNPNGMIDNFLGSVAQHFEDTFFSVVTETEFYNRRNKSWGDVWNMYFTEKTFRAMRYKHPFIFVGMPFSLKYLTSLGYVTFDKWIDESYDTVFSEEDRLKQITMEVKRLCDMPQHELHLMITDMQDVLDHNHDVLINKFYNARYQ